MMRQKARKRLHVALLFLLAMAFYAGFILLAVLRSGA